MAEPSSVVTDFDRVHAATEQLVEGVRADQWSLPTPCADWDVRALVAHLAGGDRLFGLLLDGKADDMAAARALMHAEGDPLGDDPTATFRARGQALHEAFARPGFLESIRPTPFGPQPGEFLVHMRINEHLVHGWDLARATGQPADGLPADVAERGLEMWRARLAGHPREGGPFAAEQPAPADAPAIDRLAAFLGRPL